MTALAIGLHLHPFGCWIVQQKLAEYLESLMALRYALVLVPAILVICISFLIPAAPRSWAARRQCPDRITCVAPVSRSTSWRFLWILFPLDWLSPHWLYFRAPLIGKVGVYEETYVIPRDPFSISGGTAIRSVPWSAMTNEPCPFHHWPTSVSAFCLYRALSKWLGQRHSLAHSRQPSYG